MPKRRLLVARHVTDRHAGKGRIGAAETNVRLQRALQLGVGANDLPIDSAVELVIGHAARNQRPRPLLFIQGHEHAVGQDGLIPEEVVRMPHAFIEAAGLMAVTDGAVECHRGKALAGRP